MPRFKNTPDPIPNLIANEIFVFGANSLGNHGGGAARAAALYYGAINGEVHRTGRCYGLVTLNWSGKDDEETFSSTKLSHDELVEEFRLFLRQTELESEKTFYLTKVGLGIAGYTVEEIVFALAKSFGGKKYNNLVLPIEFEKELEKLNQKGIAAYMTAC